MVALFLNYGSNWSGGRDAFARRSVLVDDASSAQSMGTPELELFASSLLDEIDRRKHLDVTVTPGVTETAVLPLRLATATPTDQLRRLATALFEVADSLEIYRRTGTMRTRNPDA